MDNKQTAVKRFFNYRINTIILLTFVLAVAAVAFTLFYGTGREVKAGITASKILIISNDDTYATRGSTKGTSAVNMKNYLVSQGFTVDIRSETTQGSVNANFVTTADTYDLVIFTEGVGQRSTNNHAPGLDANDLAFLKEYLNITNTVPGTSKAKLIIEGEDVLYDIGRSGTSTDQLNVLKINTSSSTGDRGRITQLTVLDAAHPVNAGLTAIAASTATSYQTNYQDALVATTGAKIVTNSRIGTGTYGAINTFDDGTGHRRVFMPFAWYANANNLISNQAWREKLLLNEVKWVGESKVTVTASKLAPSEIPPSSVEEMIKVNLAAAWGDPGVSGLTVTKTGTVPDAAVNKVLVYDDANNNGVIDAGETKLGEAVLAGGKATVDFGGNAFAITNGTSKNLIVAYELNGGNDGATIGASLVSSADVIIHANDKLAVVYGSFPISPATSLINLAGTGEITEPAVNATIGGSVTVKGSASEEYFLEYAPGYDAAAGWVQITHGMSGVNKNTLGAWNTTGKNGGYTLRVRLADGFLGPTVNVTVDNTAPVITANPTSNPSTVTAVIDWTTDEPSTSEVVYKKTSDPDVPGSWSTAASGIYIANHSLQLAGLASNTQHDYYVRSADSVGNTVTSAIYSFTTQQIGAYAHISSPAIIGEVIPRIGGTATITGTAKTDRNGDGNPVAWAVYYGEGASRASVTTWNLLTSSTTPKDDQVLYHWDTSPLLDGAYVLKLVAADTGITGPTANMTDYVEVVVDNTPPIIYNVHANNVSNISADITWNVNKETTAEVVYGTTGGIYSGRIADADGDNVVFIPGLTADTTYYYKVTVTDSTGHVVTSGEYNFTTTNISDSTVPSAVYGLVATGRTDTTVDMAWSAANDNTGISSYRIWRSLDGATFTTLAGIVSSTVRTFTDTGLDASTEYWYRLTAVDMAGNQSVPSNIIKVPTVAAFRVNPHGSYPKLTGMCVKCHHTHRGKKGMLFNDTQEQKVCYSCHNGTGSKYNIQQEYDPNYNPTPDPDNPVKSRHPLPMQHTKKECASCHNPHLSNSGTPSLLSASLYDADGNVTGVVSSGNQFCYACHGDVEVGKVVYAIGGSHTDFEGSVHNAALFPLPASGTRIKCVMCHWNHSSPYVRLTQAKEEENCYHCHGDTTATSKYGLTVNIKTLFQKTSHHQVEANGYAANNGARIECVNCHNPHYIKTGNLVSNAYDTNDFWDWTTNGDMSKYCIQCHDGDAPPDQHVDDSTVVPYTVAFPPLNPTTANYTGANGGWDKSGYFNSRHYIQGMNCDKCHAPHGSDNQWLLIRGEDPSSAPNATSGVCLPCHGGVAGVTPAGPNVYTGGFNAANTHPTLTTGGATPVHSNTENTNGMTRHAECYDCHDPHSATNTAGGDGNAGGELKNVLGVQPNYADTTTVFAGAADYTSVSVTKEYELCFKCHSDYGYNGTFPTPAGSIQETDLAKEFNPANPSFHNVGLPGATKDVAFGFVAGTNWTGTSVMNCTACHGADVGTATISKGASGQIHGSANLYLLKGAWNSTLTISSSTSANNLCLKCHLKPSTGTGSRFTHGGDHNSYKCFDCHATVPHGGVRPGLLAIMSSSSYTGPYQYSAEYDGAFGTASRLYLKSWPAGNWSKSNCGCNGSGHG